MVRATLVFLLAVGEFHISPCVGITSGTENLCPLGNARAEVDLEYNFD